MPAHVHSCNRSLIAIFISTMAFIGFCLCWCDHFLPLKASVPQNKGKVSSRAWTWARKDSYCWEMDEKPNLLTLGGLDFEPRNLEWNDKNEICKRRTYLICMGKNVLDMKGQEGNTRMSIEQEHSELRNKKCFQLLACMSLAHRYRSLSFQH